jgi:hypothetical protein
MRYVSFQITTDSEAVAYGAFEPLVTGVHAILRVWSHAGRPGRTFASVSSTLSSRLKGCLASDSASGSIMAPMAPEVM